MELTKENVVAYLQQDSTEEQKQSILKYIESLHKQIDDLQCEINDLEYEVDDLENEVSDLENEIEHRAFPEPSKVEQVVQEMLNNYYYQYHKDYTSIEQIMEKLDFTMRYK